MLYHVPSENLANALAAVALCNINGVKVVKADVAQDSSEKIITLDLCPASKRDGDRAPAIEMVLDKTSRAVLGCYGKLEKK